ncbi:MAG: C40 family peptidase [Thermomicrobiales bacterium]
MRKLATTLAAALLASLLLVSIASPVRADTDLNVGGLAIIANTGGDPILVRSGPGYQYAVVGHAGEGDIVTVSDGPIQGDDGNPWYQISNEALTGYVFADFLVLPENAPAHPQVQAQALAVSSGGGGYAATVAGTGGDGVRLRDGANTDAAILLVIPEAATVQVLGDPQPAGGDVWYPVSYDGSTGYMAGAYLGSQGAVKEATTVSTAAKPLTFAAGTNVQVSGTGEDALRIRADAGADAGIIGHAPAGAVLQVVGGPATDGAGNAWYQIDYDGLDGYVAADFLAWTDATVSARKSGGAMLTTESVAAPAESVAAPAAPAPASNPDAGAAVVAFAMQYAGYPYVWGGTSPSGFDCSGFTLYVTRHVLGVNIGRTTDDQINAGVAVDASDLQPGDLVFFQNTYQPGLSHVGIYIGGGQMISAVSEQRGVAVINIWDGFWGPRYYGARRV